MFIWWVGVENMKQCWQDHTDGNVPVDSWWSSVLQVVTLKSLKVIGMYNEMDKHRSNEECCQEDITDSEEN
jgi:hypothetical protein